MKKHWKGTIAILLASAVVGGAIYYTNLVYIPRMRAQQPVNTINLNSADDDSGTSDYEYTIHPENPETSIDKAEKPVEVEKEKSGDVTIHRTWDKKEEDMDTTVSSPEDTVSTNIASGGDKITGADGTYHGETPAPAPATPTPTTTTKSSSTTVAATPEASNTPSSSNTSSGDTEKTPQEPANTPAPSSSKPKDGDTRVVDGQKQDYWEGFGWVDEGTGSITEPSAGNYETSGEHIGEMG